MTEATETDGQTRYTLVASNFSANSVYSDQTARLTVGTDGALYAVNVTGELSSGAAFAYEFDLTQVGVEAVERPDWVADAPAPVDTRPTVGFENCSKPYLTLDNPGPDAVPSGTVVEATLDGTTYSVTLDESVAAEGRVAIYLDASETLQTAPIGDVPANRTAMPKEGQFTVVTGEGMLLSQGAGGFGCSSAGDGNGNGESDGS